MSSARFTNEVFSDTQKALDHLVSGSITGIVVIGKDKKVEYVNDFVCTTLGYSNSELLGHDFLEYIHPDSRDSLDTIYKQRMTGNDFVKIYDAKVTNKKGQSVDVQICSITMNMGQDNVKILAQILDRTDVEVSRRALASIENKYQTLVETMNEGLSVIDDNGRIIFANSALCRLAGYEGSTLLGIPIGHILRGSSMDEIVEKVNRRRDGLRDRYETDLVHSSGKLIPVMISASPMYDSNHNYSGSISVITDISNIYDGKKQVQQIFNAFSDPAFLWKRQDDGVIILEMFNEPMRRLSNGVATRHIGSSLVEVFGRNPELVCCVQQVFKDGERIRIESPFDDHPGPKRWFIWDFIRHSEDSVLMIAIDITHRMKSEKNLQTMNERALFYLDLLQHDMRNKLQEVQGYAELARDASEEDERFAFLTSALDAINSCSNLIYKTSALKKMVDLPLTDVSLSDAILDAMNDFNDIEKIVNLRVSGPIIKANELLRELFSFLIGYLHRRNHNLNKRLWVEFHESEYYYEIVLFDNGPIVPESQVCDLFNPLKRFGDRVELLIAQQIVDSYNGTLSARNDTTRFGIPLTEFCIQFPKIQ